MRHHYVPRYLLRGFTDREELFWVYNKRGGDPYRTGVNNVAQETGFYSPETERNLANVIEEPANSVIKKIREREPISIADKATLAKYMAALLKRVPRTKELFKKMAPEVARKTFEEFKADLDEISAPEEMKIKYTHKAAQILEKFATDPPKDVWLSSIPPDTTPDIVRAIGNMTWVFARSKNGPVLFASDNPVFFFEHIGIGNRDSEISFPLSSTIIIWGTWKNKFKDCDYVPFNLDLMREFNRRTATNATRYIYFHGKERWIPDFIRKHHRLNLIK